MDWSDVNHFLPNKQVMELHLHFDRLQKYIFFYKYLLSTRTKKINAVHILCVNMKSPSTCTVHKQHHLVCVTASFAVTYMLQYVWSVCQSVGLYNFG